MLIIDDALIDAVKTQIQIGSGASLSAMLVEQPNLLGYLAIISATIPTEQREVLVYLADVIYTSFKAVGIPELASLEDLCQARKTITNSLKNEDFTTWSKEEIMGPQPRLMLFVVTELVLSANKPAIGIAANMLPTLTAIINVFHKSTLSATVKGLA